MSLKLSQPLLFGSYRLSARIATGGMAEVYAARRIERDGRVGPLVALKRLLPHLASEAAIVRMFLNEARITAQIHHQNVIRILELGQHEGEPFIAMELLAGHSFSDLRQRAAHNGERVPLGITLRVLTDACRGLDAAHRAEDEHGRPLMIVHRDFTPDNIHVGLDGTVKVIDFGIAKAQSMGSGTEPGTLKGKFFYMSPEMIAGRPVDHRADLFAAGVMLYEQLCGRRPFTGASPDEVLERIAESRPRRPAEFDPSVPPALEAICLMALKQDPNDRFKSLEEFIVAIEQVGGVAEIASDDKLSRYVHRLFPLAADPKTAAIAHAREVDPSHPRAGTEEEVPRQEEKPQPTPPEEDVPRRRGGRGRAVTLFVLALALAAAGGFYARTTLLPKVPVAERLKAAEAAEERQVRLDALDGVAEDASATAEQLARAGELLLEIGANQPALEVAQAFAQRFPKASEARLLEARAHVGLRHGRSAEAAIAEARKLSPDSPEPDLVLAELKELQADLPGATAALAAALQKDPKSTRVARRQGYLLSQSGRLEEAAEVLSSVLKRGFDPEAASELAFVRYRQGRDGDAEALLKRALKARPAFARAHYYLGAVHFKQGDRAAAERSYLAAEKLAPDDARVLVALCQVYAHAGRKDDVLGVQSRMQERFPENAASLKRQCEVGR